MSEKGKAPEGWGTAELGSNELAKFDYENLSSGTAPNYAFKYITLENVDNGTLLQYIDCEYASASPRARRIVHYDDLLISTVRPNLHSHYHIKNEVSDIICSTGFCVIKTDNSKLDSDFLYSLFYSKIIDEQIETIVTGSNYPAISSNDIKRLVIPIPPLPEQHAIAEVLSDMDGLIVSLEKLIAKKKAIKQGAMQELLAGKRRLPGFSGEWVEKKLGEVVPIERGQMITSDQLKNGIFPVIAGGKTQAGVHNIYNRQSNTITISASGASAGYVAFHIKPIFASDCSTICEGDNYDVKYIFYLLQSRQEEIYKAQTGGAQPHIHPKDVAQMNIFIPHRKFEQSTIAAVLSDMDTEIEALTAKLNKAKLIKQGMMQELLTGRIRLIKPEAKAVPATKVLEFPKRKKAARGHNQAIEDAVILAVVTDLYAKEQYPLAPFYAQKLPYLLHRYMEGVVEGYTKKAAGPYNPTYRYKTALPIALKNNYVIGKKAEYRGKSYLNLVTGNNIDKAKNYFMEWHGEEPLEWLEQFQNIENRRDELELLTTVDMAMVELRDSGKAITVSTVKEIIQNSDEWKAKLKREIFSDKNISRAIAWSIKLFGEGE